MLTGKGSMRKGRFSQKRHPGRKQWPVPVRLSWRRSSIHEVGVDKDFRRGFTFKELLIVIAIISLLAALSLPAMNRAKVSARSIACESNLRQIGMALNLHVNDFGAYPLYADANPDLADRLSGLWDKTLLEYCGRNRKLFECPAWKWADVWGGGVAASPPVDYSVNGFNFCYGYNAFGTRPPPLDAGLGLGRSGQRSLLRVGYRVGQFLDLAQSDPRRWDLQVELFILTHRSGSSVRNVAPGTHIAYFPAKSRH
jgi:prepilin-type N-terminal cleavage/methylation domain-containing protein